MKLSTRSIFQWGLVALLAAAVVAEASYLWWLMEHKAEARRAKAVAVTKADH